MQIETYNELSRYFSEPTLVLRLAQGAVLKRAGGERVTLGYVDTKPQAHQRAH